MRAALFVLAALAGLVLGTRSARARVGAEGATATLYEIAAGEFVSLDDIYQRNADAVGLDWRLVKAIAQHESGENPDAVNAQDNESLGLMQVLCRPDGRGGCSNRLNVTGWSDATRARLLEPEFNVYIGAQILAANIAQYGVAKGIAVYNAWDQHNAPTNGPFKNQAYVDDVLRRAAELGYTGGG